MSVGNFGIMAETSSNTEKQVTVKFHTNLPPDLKVPEDQLVKTFSTCFRKSSAALSELMLDPGCPNQCEKAGFEQDN